MAVMVASSSRAAETELGEAVTMRSWRTKSWTCDGASVREIA